MEAAGTELYFSSVSSSMQVTEIFLCSSLRTKFFTMKQHIPSGTFSGMQN
jgi:hypothetical protein